LKKGQRNYANTCKKNTNRRYAPKRGGEKPSTNVVSHPPKEIAKERD